MRTTNKSLICFLLLLTLGYFIIGTNVKLYAQESKLEAAIELSFSEDEDKKTITALATNEDGSPIEELDVYFYVKRTFSLLPIGDAFNTTDENGEVSITFPDDLPGDETGKVDIVVKIIESDEYNDLTVEIDKNWGVKTALEKTDEERSLWAAAANAPWTLVISTSSMILATWIIYWYIIFILFKISKIKPLKSK